MQKTQFTFGNTKDDSKGMSEAKTLYSSEIDAQAKKGGYPAASKENTAILKKTNFSIGDKKGSMGGSEAHD